MHLSPDLFEIAKIDAEFSANFELEYSVSKNNANNTNEWCDTDMLSVHLSSNSVDEYTGDRSPEKSPIKYTGDDDAMLKTLEVLGYGRTAKFADMTSAPKNLTQKIDETMSYSERVARNIRQHHEYVAEQRRIEHFAEITMKSIAEYRGDAVNSHPKLENLDTGQPDDIATRCQKAIDKFRLINAQADVLVATKKNEIGLQTAKIDENV